MQCTQNSLNEFHFSRIFYRPWTGQKNEQLIFVLLQLVGHCLTKKVITIFSDKTSKK